MPRYVALLRGVNVGGRRTVAMAELRALFESLGHTDVSTLIQSGNVIFRATKPCAPESLEAAIEKRFGIDVNVVLRTPRELRHVVEKNPFTQVDPSKLHEAFMARTPSPGAVRNLDPERYQPEEFSLRDRDLYLHLPNGVGRAKLPASLNRSLGIPTTIRNWATVTKLADVSSR